MGVSENKDIARTFFEAGNRGELQTCLDLFADDATWTNIGTTKLSKTFVGKQAMIDELLGPLFGALEGGITSRVDNIVAEGDFVVVESRGTARTKDGRPYDNTYCHVFTIRDGKIRAVTEYMDTELVSAVFGR